jgi:hypothetical protein
MDILIGAIVFLGLIVIIRLFDRPTPGVDYSESTTFGEEEVELDGWDPSKSTPASSTPGVYRDLSKIGRGL